MVLGGEGAHDPDTAEVLVHDAADHRQTLLERQPGVAQRQLHDRRAPGDEGHEAERDQPEHEVGAEQQIGADADEHRQQDEANQAGRKEHPHAVDVEDAERDQVAGMHAVVEAERQPLDLLITGEPQLIADLVPDRFAEIVLQHREDAAADADGEQDQRGAKQGLTGRLRARTGDVLGLVDRAAEQARNGELQARPDEGGHDSEGRRPGVAERHARDAQQGAEPATPLGSADMRQRHAAGPDARDFLGFQRFGQQNEIDGTVTATVSPFLAAGSIHVCRRSVVQREKWSPSWRPARRNGQRRLE